ncbi:hypothetical protein BKA62DRAFT_762594 [Auriculariales sp. MPI-PUGE-AT-0066]|nr:hypothetical protein BKA62DRAFT_762594 [Auriculariales sp. MPI-PUGE-AT-0066]
MADQVIALAYTAIGSERMWLERQSGKRTEMGKPGDIGYIHYDGWFHKLFNIFDGNEIIPALPESMRTRICSQIYTEPKSYGATFRNEIGAGVGPLAQECADANAEMHCIAVRSARLRKKRYLKLQLTKLLVSVTSAFRSALGGLFRSSASTPSRTDRSLTGRCARDEAGETHAADSLEDMVLDCILDDYPDLDGVLVDSLFRFDERMIGSEAATFRHEVLIIETQSTSNGRFGIMLRQSGSDSACRWLRGAPAAAPEAGAGVGATSAASVAGSAGEYTGAGAGERAAAVAGGVPEDAQAPTEKLVAEQAFDLMRQVLEGEQDSALEQAAESAMEKRLKKQLVLLEQLLRQRMQQPEQLERKEDDALRAAVAAGLHEAAAAAEGVAEATALEAAVGAAAVAGRAGTGASGTSAAQAEKLAQKAQRQAQSEVRWYKVKLTPEQEHTTMEKRS